MAESPKMLMEKEGPLGWIIFNQPEKRNAVSQEMWQMVPEMVKDLEEDEDIRVIILRGAGDQAFVAGADISQFQDRRRHHSTRRRRSGVRGRG
jgi:enoyl-CoA hydratase